MFIWNHNPNLVIHVNSSLVRTQLPGLPTMYLHSWRDNECMQEGNQPGQDERGITNTSTSAPELRNIVSPCQGPLHITEQLLHLSSIMLCCYCLLAPHTQSSCLFHHPFPVVRTWKELPTLTFMATQCMASPNMLQSSCASDKSNWNHKKHLLVQSQHQIISWDCVSTCQLPSTHWLN